MKKNKNYKTIIPIAILFYLITGGLTILMFARYGNAYIAGNFEARGATANHAEVIGVPATETASTEEPPAEAPAEAEPEPAPPEAAPEEDLTSEDSEIAVEEPETPVIPSSDRKYYVLQTVTRRQVLHLREAPNMKAKILYRMPPGTLGYVLHMGKYWSYIIAETDNGYQMGFAANKYLAMEEIPPEEMPPELLDWPVPDLEESPVPRNA